MSEEELAQVRVLYAGKVTMVDTYIGLLLDHLERLGLLENTMVIITSDHGILLGEHGVIGKPWTKICDANVYQELAQIPLIVYSPETAPQRRNELIQPIDLFPTILEAVGVDIPENIHGNSLLPLLDGAGKSWSREYAWWGRFGESIVITDGEWLLMKWPDGKSNGPLYWYSLIPPAYPKMLSSIGEKEGNRFPVEVERGDQNTALYNIKNDNAQEHDIAGKHPDKVKALSQALTDQLIAIGAPREQLERLDLQKYIK